MSNLITLVQKNFRLLLRARMSSLIVILGPLLVILLVGIAFNNSNLFKVNVGMYAPEETELVQSFLEDLGENHFAITRFTSAEDCIDAIKTGVVHLCAVFSDTFSLEPHAKNEIIFYADFSRVNLVYNILEATSATISMTSSELSLNLTTQLITTLEEVRDLMKAKRGILVSMTTQNDQLYQRIEQVTESIKGLDLAIDKTLFDTGNLSAQEAKVDFLMKRIDGMVTDNLQQTQDLVTALRNKLGTVAISESDKNNLTVLLDDAQTDLDLLTQQTDQLFVDTKQDIHQLSLLATQIISQLDSTSSKLSAATGAKSSTAENLDYMKFTIDRSLHHIIDMQQTINNIENLANKVEVTDPATIVNPITTTVKPVTSDKSRLNYIFPVLLVLIALFTSVMLVATLIQIEKGSNAAFRNFMTPVRDITSLAAIFFTAMIILLLQLTVILVVAGLFFSTQVLFTIFDTLTVLFFVCALFTSIGMVIGYLFKSPETANLASISVGSLFLFLSDVILPLETVPSFVSSLVQYNPFVIAVNLLRRTILFQAHVYQMGIDLVLLVVYAVVLFLFVVFIHYITKKSHIIAAVYRRKKE